MCAGHPYYEIVGGSVSPPSVLPHSVRHTVFAAQCLPASETFAGGNLFCHQVSPGKAENKKRRPLGHGRRVHYNIAMMICGMKIPGIELLIRQRLSSSTGNKWEQKRGDGRIRTGDRGFADPCLATWPRRPESIGAEEGI